MALAKDPNNKTTYRGTLRDHMQMGLDTWTELYEKERERRHIWEENRPEETKQTQREFRQRTCDAQNIIGRTDNDHVRGTQARNNALPAIGMDNTPPAIRMEGGGLDRWTPGLQLTQQAPFNSNPRSSRRHSPRLAAKTQMPQQTPVINPQADDTPGVQRSTQTLNADAAAQFIREYQDRKSKRSLDRLKRHIWRKEHPTQEYSGGVDDGDLDTEDHNTTAAHGTIQTTYDGSTRGVSI
jgi:hypothetical protein